MLFAPGDASGDCHLFTVKLKEIAEFQGVLFRYNEEITCTCIKNFEIIYVETTKGMRYAPDVLVVCSGADVELLRSQFHVDLPILPIKVISENICLFKLSLLFTGLLFERSIKRWNER